MHKIKPQIHPAIVIPMHKPDLTPEERVSLIQCQKILGGYPIFLLHPEGMEIQTYKSIFPMLKTLTAPPESMGSIAGYNRLMISPFVFNALKAYTHILIHEPDAIVLKDDLLFWCEQDFDYIGAPWFLSDLPNEFKLRATGNFGLSLMKTKTINTLFARNPRWFRVSMIIRDILRGLRGQRDAFKRALSSIGPSGRLSCAHKLYLDHCDIFWSFLVPKVSTQFKIAPPSQAIYFSWEKDPQKSWVVCEGKLPFGIHAWSKYNLPFLRPLLIQSGIAIEVADPNK